MFDFTSLPSSVAEPFNGLVITDQYKKLTFTQFVEEGKLYINLNRELTKLETSTDVNYIELEKIIRLSEQLQVEQEWKEEVLLRIDWLQRLYKAKSEVCSADTKDKIKQLRELVAPVQTCPLKSQLLAEIGSREASVPEESISKEPTQFELLMENAINEIGDEFINLGKVGREFVINEVLKQEGELANTAKVQECTIQLEHRVHVLLEITDRVEMIGELEQLPLSGFSSLDTVKKGKVAESLIQDKGWGGLYSLDRRIAHLINENDREEREKYEKENVIDLPDGKAATMIDMRNYSH